MALTVACVPTGMKIGVWHVAVRGMHNAAAGMGFRVFLDKVKRYG